VATQFRDRSGEFALHIADMTDVGKAAGLGKDLAKENAAEAPRD
jgi:hypothetical protein